MKTSIQRRKLMKILELAMQAELKTKNLETIIRIVREEAFG